jgi:hypothetical protein
MKLDIQPTKVSFKGHSSTKNVTYQVELNLYGEIDPHESKVNHTDRDIEMVLRKKELAEEYWPRLLKDKGKVGSQISPQYMQATDLTKLQVHFLRTDFDKWVDEDEQDANPDEDFMSQYGGNTAFGGGGDGGFGNIDFSKLGAGPGGDPAAPDDSDEEDLPDDDEMPDLEETKDSDKVPAGEDEKKTAAGGKIEEVE